MAAVRRWVDDRGELYNSYMRKSAIVILSNKLTPARELNWESRLRVDRGIELYRAGHAENIIMCGGPGLLTEPTPDGQYIPYGSHPVHSEVMRDYAVSQGISADDILLQAHSRDTVAEAYFLKEQFLVPRAWRCIVVVTSAYHVERTTLIYEHVLGPNYSVELDGVQTELDNDPEIIQKELESINIFKEQFGIVKFGDSKQLERILYTRHTLYKDMPEEHRIRFYP